MRPAAARWGALLLGAWAAGGCLGSVLVECNDHQLVCAFGQVCSPADDRCVVPEQITSCEGLADNAGCDYSGNHGSCAAGFCMALEDPGPPFRLSVTLAGGGAGAVTSAPAGIGCGASCAARFAAGTTVTLTAVAAEGSSFAGWSGACGGAAGCSLPMTAATSVTATFEPQAAR